MRFMPLILAMSFGLAAPALAGARLTIEDVRNMAFAKGIVKIEEVELHNGIWKVEGEDAGGYEIKMNVDAGRSSSSSGTTRPYFLAPTINLFFAAIGAYIQCCRRESTMAINSLRNKPFGPGGGTRRLHQSDQI